MFEYQMNPFQSVDLQDKHCSGNIDEYQYNNALNHFSTALLQGKFFRLKMKVLHRQPFLHDLNAVKSSLHLRGSSYAGIKVVGIHSIIGSEGKISDFDKGFHPISEAARQRWINIAIAYLSLLPLPPVQLTQIGDAYFVRDGHHRISVARAFGQTVMDAEVITWKAAPPFPWQSEAKTKGLFSLKRVDLST